MALLAPPKLIPARGIRMTAPASFSVSLETGDLVFAGSGTLDLADGATLNNANAVLNTVFLGWSSIRFRTEAYENIESRVIVQDFHGTALNLSPFTHAAEFNVNGGGTLASVTLPTNAICLSLGLANTVLTTVDIAPCITSLTLVAVAGGTLTAEAISTILIALAASVVSNPRAGVWDSSGQTPAVPYSALTAGGKAAYDALDVTWDMTLDE